VWVDDGACCSNAAPISHWSRPPTKILTALAALAPLAPAHRFTTRIYADAPPDADGAAGSLAVRGGGDPALTSEEWWRLAADLRRQGLRRVRGALILDDTLFEQQRWNPAWDAVSARAFHAPVGALSANYGSFAVEVQPTRAGATPRIGLDPPIPFFELIDRTKPAAARRRRARGCRNARPRRGRGAPASGDAVTIFAAPDPARAAAVCACNSAHRGSRSMARITAPVPPDEAGVRRRAGESPDR
jgi:D-alanyl-D-alanine carboxypeptidase/D-alanyl-D-alanine-endopeptidase (penicillin-binding protein 4)